MKSSVVYRYSEDAYLLGWENRRVGLFIERDNAAQAACALDTFDRAGWGIEIHPDSDGARINSPDNKVRYFLRPRELVRYAELLIG